MIAIVTHAVFLEGKDIYGPPHAVSTYLNKKRREHIFIKHALFPTQRFSIIETYARGQLVTQQKIHIKSPLYPLRILEEQVINIRTMWSNKCQLYIAVNPVNYLSARVLKMFRRLEKAVYFSADFAITRFDNPLMNKLYHTLDTLAQNNAHQTWSVSARIVEYRKKHGLNKKRNILVRNAPFFDGVKRRSFAQRKPHDLVVVSALEPGIAFELLIEVIEIIKQKVADVRLILIGSGSKQQVLKDLVRTKRLTKHVVFKGALSHQEMFDVTTRCGVGIALYDVADPNHFRYFSDPMKVRDYLASGLPVLISGNSAIGEELVDSKAGFIVKLEKNAIQKSVLQLLKNRTFHQQMRINAIELARTTDAQKTFDTLLKTI